MNFRDFMTSTTAKLRALMEDSERPLVVKPPKNPTAADIERLIAQLRDDRQCERAEAILAAIGAKAKPALEKAALDPVNHSFRFRPGRGDPLQQIMGLLGKLDSAAQYEAAVKLMKAVEPTARKVAATTIGSSGRLDAIPLIERLLNDPNGYVRSYVWLGARDAIEKHPAFRAALYPLYLRQCSEEWTETLNDAPASLVRLDEARALVDLAGESILQPDNPEVHQVLQVLANRRATVPESRLRKLLENSAPRLNDERSYPHHYIVAYCLVLLAKAVGKTAEPEIRAFADSTHEEIQRSVGDALCVLAGLSDPEAHLWQQVEKVGVEKLTPPQKIVYFAERFSAEVCNGGLSQFFGNSSGQSVPETLDALRTLGHPESLAALEFAVAEIGPCAGDRNRDKRLAPFATRYEELRKKFDPYESSFYRSKGRFELRLRMYMIDHVADFGGR